MEKTFLKYLSGTLPQVSSASVQAVLQLADEGATVPFMARYRKEKTGNLDEVQIRTILDSHTEYNELLKRKEFIIGELTEQKVLTPELKVAVESCWDSGQLEELYRPYKKKKKTKAKIAEEAGLLPLAEWILQLGRGEIEDPTTLEVKAKGFINPAADFVTYEHALKGAQDIIVEKVYNNPELRALVRDNYFTKGKVKSAPGKKYKDKSKYEMYVQFEEAVTSLQTKKASHRYLAMRRGWNEEELVVTVVGDDELLLRSFERQVASKPASQVQDFLYQAAKIALTVHVIPSITNEVHKALKDKADEFAITVFAENVRKVLLASPYGARCVLGVDPGLRTGCKIALIDKQGNFISHTVMHIQGDGAEDKAQKLFAEVLKQIEIDAIAVGNGTGGREAEVFLRKILKTIDANIPVIMVNESGASVYSASDVAREEFPDLDLTVRGAISIARRLQDPLAELVKIEPKSIGVGQYQHDVSQTHLKKSLGDVVESCVNVVGVDLNTASAPLLRYVSGTGPALAQNIVDHRKKNGLFQERADLLKVPSFSTKTFEQAAGFLRIRNGKVPLDSTGVHPERYTAVREMAQDLGVSVSGLLGEGAKKLLEHRTKWAQLVGEFTFDDIVRELEKPGRDPRDPFKVFAFRDDIFEVKDLKPGMICPGIVTNVTNFGAFVDVGVHQDGLVHISEISTQFVDDPAKVLSPGDQVTVRVLAADVDKNQVSLSMILNPGERAERGAPRANREHDGDRPQRRPRREGDGQGGEPRRDFRGPRDGDRRGQGGDTRGGERREGNRPFPPRESRGDGPRDGARAGGRDQGRPSGGRDSGRPNRDGGRPQREGGGGGAPRGKPPGQPFNNPFAALAQQLKKN
jgi:uncharacterized protein